MITLDISFLSIIRDNTEVGVNLNHIYEMESFHNNMDEKSKLEQNKFLNDFINNLRVCICYGIIKKKGKNYCLCNELLQTVSKNPADFWKVVKSMILKKQKKIRIRKRDY